MDENSSDSICSDDTEYLLGQNVSIRDIDDYDERPSKTSSSKHQSGNPKKRNVNAVAIQDNTRYIQKHPTKDQSKNTRNQRTKANELTPPDPRKLQKAAKQNTRGVHDDRNMAQASLQTNTRATGLKEKKSKAPKENIKSHREERHVQEDHSAQSQKTIMENKRDWRNKMSPANHEHSLEWNQTNEGIMYGSPEHVDVVSMTSEATEELLKDDDELDGSIIQKLKELNLAVNFDPDTQGNIYNC